MLQCESFNLIGWLGLAEGPYYFSSKVSPAKCGDQSHQGGGHGEKRERGGSYWSSGWMEKCTGTIPLRYHSVLTK